MNAKVTVNGEVILEASAPLHTTRPTIRHLAERYDRDDIRGAGVLSALVSHLRGMAEDAGESVELEWSGDYEMVPD